MILKDDKTGKPSGTTLRTWISATIFYALVIAGWIIEFWIGLSKNQISIIEMAGWFAAGSAGFYTAKRVTESMDGRKKE